MEYICTNLPKLVNSLGLGFDIVAVILLWRFGLPAPIDRTGAVGIAAMRVDTAQIKEGKRYDFWARIGLGLIILGFIVQVVGNWIRG